MKQQAIVTIWVRDFSLIALSTHYILDERERVESIEVILPPGKCHIAHIESAWQATGAVMKDIMKSGGISNEAGDKFYPTRMVLQLQARMEDISD